MAELTELEIGGRKFRARPMTLKRHRELAPIRAELIGLEVRGAELMIRVGQAQEALQATVAEVMTGESSHTQISEPVQHATHQIHELSAEKELLDAEMMLAQLKAIAACLEPVDGEQPDDDWWADHYDFRDLQDHMEGLGLVRPTSPTID